MTTNGNGNGNSAQLFTLLKWLGGVLATVFAALMVWAVTGILDTVGQLQRDMISMQEWRSQISASDSALRSSLPRETFELEKKLLYAEMAQIRARVDAQEARRDQ